MNYLIGQRVIYSHVEIVVVCQPPRGRERARDGNTWVTRANGVEQCVSDSNLKPLPGGQL